MPAANPQRAGGPRPARGAVPASLPRARLLRLGSSWRTRPPARTLQLGGRVAVGLGVSRVTDITRMDFLGLPVYVSVRPRGLALCVHAGKGVMALDAQTGALMEALEYAAAEPQRHGAPLRPLRVAELVAQFEGGLHLVDFAPLFGVRVSPRQTVPTVNCERLPGGPSIALPAELVFLPYVPPDGRRIFGWTSTGLASGNTVDEATLHGLLEVLERDATVMNLPSDASRWVRPSSFPEPFRSLASRWQRLGVKLAVREVPNAFGLPCFEACLHEPTSTSINLAGGSGLHVERDIALARAICEAAQSRLSHIHGGRDDITNFYAKYESRNAAIRVERETHLLQRMFNRRRAIALSALPARQGSANTVPAALRELLQRLADAGFGHVFRHCFAAAPAGLAVVKVIVARCEQNEGGTRRMGPRLFERVLGRG